jgi:hypothetical protein
MAVRLVTLELVAVDQSAVGILADALVAIDILAVVLRHIVYL